jgi:hypothetical protein
MISLSSLASRLRRAPPKRPTTEASRFHLARDRAGLPERDPGPEAVIHAAIDWLRMAQDHSASRDEGVARDFSLETGWATSYPETTGYIVPTMLAYARRYGDPDARRRAASMLDWLVGIQLPGGGFQGGRIDSVPVVPVTFNTGQILLGLAAGVAEFGDRYRAATEEAASWLAGSLDPDGCWRRHPTPFAASGEKAYETHVSWGLFEAERVLARRVHGEAGLANVRWALTRQHENGWFADNCLSDPRRPLTHTIGYVLRGVVEAYRFSGERTFLDAACRTAQGVMGAIAQDGYLPGRLDAQWKPAARYACLTGSAQIAHCLLMLYQSTGDARYRDNGYALNEYVRRTVDVAGAPGIRGGVKGSFPIDGDYGAYEFLDWAAKFTIDANMLEIAVRASDGAGAAPRTAPSQRVA